MNFKQRLLRYIIGLSIGCLVVFVIFPNYDWLGWTPAKQMNKRIREATWVPSERGLCRMKCLNVDVARFDQARFYGEVDFGMSNVHEGTPRYQLNHEDLKFQILVEDTLITLIDVDRLSSAVTCDCK
ncbi:MAG: hypothetical protein ACOYLH_04080 [Flavobacteriales bacterium]